MKVNRYKIPLDFQRGIPSLTIFMMTCCGTACATTYKRGIKDRTVEM